MSTSPPPIPTDDADQAARLGHDMKAALADLLEGPSGADPADLPPEAAEQLARARASARQVDVPGTALTALAEGAPDPEEPAETELADLLDRIDARWRGHGAACGRRFLISRDAGLPARLRGHDAAFARILDNLIADAMKTSDTSDVMLAVTHRPDGMLAFRVTDDGPGFAEAGPARPFRAGGHDGDPARLGLAIAQSLANDVGGVLEVANRPEGGASATLLLPTPVAAADRPAPSLDLSGREVLLIGDSDSMATLMTRMIKSAGARVTHHAAAKPALEDMAERRADLAIVDIELPDIPGEDVIAHLADGGHGPVLAVTGHAGADCHARIRAAGAAGILVKPVTSPDALAAAIAGLSLPAPAPRTAPLDELGLDRFLSIAGEGGRATLLTHLQADLGRVAEGLGRGIESGDHTLIAARAHVLVSLAGALGASPLRRLAERIDTAATAGDGVALSWMVPVARRRIEAILTRLVARAPAGVATPG